MKNILESHENMQQGLKKHCGMLLTDATAPVVLNSIDPNSNIYIPNPLSKWATVKKPAFMKYSLFTRDPYNRLL